MTLLSEPGIGGGTQALLLLEVAPLRCGGRREHKEVRKEKKRSKKLSLGIFYFLVSSMVDAAARWFLSRG